MFWLLPPAILLGKLIYDAVTDDEQDCREEERRRERDYERACERERETERERATAQAQARQREAKQTEIVADARHQVTRLYSNHSQVLRGNVPTQAGDAFTFSTLQLLAKQRVGTDPHAMLETLGTVVPGTAISAKQSQVDAHMTRLAQEIQALEKLKLAFGGRV